MKLARHYVVLFATVLLGISAHAYAGWTAENGGKVYGSAEAACRSKVSEGVSYKFSHIKEVQGRPDLRECYVKAKEGDFVAFWGYATVEDGPAEDEKKKTEKDDKTASNESSSGASSSQNDKGQCAYEFKKSTTPLGGDPLADTFCANVSGNSPSHRVYPKDKNGKSGPKMLTEVDALRDKTWYECKCGYLSTVQGAKSGKKNALMKFEGPDGLDKKIRTQADVASACGYDYRIVVANQTVADYFRERYSFATVEQVNFQPCE